MDTTEQHPMRLIELAEAAGLPPRTVRLYIARGLLPGPLRAGRNAAYGREHLETLRKIRAWQEKGLTLVQIRNALLERENREALPEPGGLWQYQIAPEVTVLVRHDIPPWRQRQIRLAMQRMQEELKTQQEGLGDDSEK